MKTIYRNMLLTALMFVTTINAQSQTKGPEKNSISITPHIKDGMVELRFNLSKSNPSLTIERSFDGENWNQIGTITNRGGDELQYTDSLPVMGLSFYRVVAATGQSDIVSVTLYNTGYNVYPNLTNEKIT